MSSPQVSSNTVPPFPKPRLPPQHIPVLSSRIGDLLSKATVIVLCSREDLLFFLANSSLPEPAHHQVPIPVATRASTLYPSVHESSKLPSTLSSEDEVDAMSDAASSESSLSSFEFMNNKIPKPNGEPGRPGRGGYNLEAQLAWNSMTFLKLKKFVHRLIKKHLDITKCKSHQSNAAIRLVVQEATKAFPDLEDYSSCWPVRDLIQMHLKYTSRRARLSQPMGVGNMEEKKKAE